MRQVFNGAAKTMRQQSKSLKYAMWGKCWEPGDKVVAFYKINESVFYDEEGNVVPTDKVEYEITTAGMYGYPISGDLGLKRFFVPSIGEINIKTGRPYAGREDILYQFSRVSKLYLQSMKESEIERISKTNLPDATKRDKIMAIENKYSPDNIGNDAVKPAVGGLQLRAYAPVYLVPLKEDGTPNMEKAGTFCRKVSASFQEVLSIFQNPRFCKPENGYLEVVYQFPQKAKGLASQVSPAGVLEEDSLLTRFPEISGTIKLALDSILTGEALANNFSDFTPITEAEVFSAIQGYGAMNSEYLEHIPDSEKEKLRANAHVLDKLQLVDSIPSGPIKELVIEGIEEYRQKVEDDIIDEEKEDIRLTLDENAKTEAPSIMDIMNNKEDDSFSGMPSLDLSEDSLPSFN